MRVDAPVPWKTVLNLCSKNCPSFEGGFWYGFLGRGGLGRRYGWCQLAPVFLGWFWGGGWGGASEGDS